MRRKSTSTSEQVGQTGISDQGTANELAQIKHTLNLFKWGIYIILGIVVIGILGWTVVLGGHRIGGHTSPISPVPLSISKSVNFSVYYPVQSELPSGYTLDTRSFTSNELAVVYKVAYGHGQNLVFSVQKKPSKADIQGFYAKHLPLHNNVVTGVGAAAIGAISTQTLVSLPTTGNAWLLMTGPASVNQPQLKRVLQSITH